MIIKNNQLPIILLHQTCAISLVCLAVLSPSLSAAAPVIPGFYGKVSLPAPAINTLPQLRSAPTGATVAEDGSRSQLTVTQNQDRVTIDWNSFNIGAAATVRFDQKKDGVPQRDWAALNRIYDANPSQIYGKLQADGKVYLINQNGILFGPGSQVNVGSLAASALNLWQSDFAAGLLRFRSENYQHPDYDPADPARNLTLPPPNPEATVANHGNITTGNGGSIFLLGPRVENGGTISAPMGRINLVAVEGAGSGANPDNSEVSIQEEPMRGLADVSFSDKAVPGTTVNLEGGQLIADSGRIGMYGATVRQEGLVRAVTAIKRGGDIYLAARDRVTTGARSLTESQVSESDEKVDQSFIFSAGVVNMGGLSTRTGENTDPVKQPLQRIEHYGAIAAPGGEVNLSAKERVFLESGSSITVAGLWLDRPAEANLLEVQLNSVELANDYGQKSGPLKGEKFYIDVLAGSAIGDIKGYYLAREKTAQERSTNGGTITIDGNRPTNSAYSPLGELIVKEGAIIDISGGGVRYASGAMGTSRLLCGNRVYDMGSGPQWLSYDKILGQQTVTYRKFGISEEFKGLYFAGGSAVKDYTPGRVVGSAAGTLSVVSRQVVLDGTLLAAVTRGLYQTKATSHADQQAYDISVARGLEQPVGGTLKIGQLGGTGDLSVAPQDSVVEEIAVLPTTTPLAGSFAAESPLTGTRSELSAALLSSVGLSRLSLFANTTIATEAGARLTLLPRGIFSNESDISNFTARARRIEHRGEVVVPGGSAEFKIVDNITSNPDMVSTLYFAPGSVVSVKGETIDNSSASLATGDDIRIGRTSGGRVTIQDLTVDGYFTGNNLVVARGALLDVSGGYEIDQKGKIIGGDAGSLELQAMNLSLAGELRGLALPGKRGGEIKLHAGEIVVGRTGFALPENLPPDAVPPDFLRGRLFLADDRLRETGFTRIGLTAINDVTFTAGSVLEPSQARLPVPTGGAANGTDNVLVAAGGAVNSQEYLGVTSVSATAGLNIVKGTTLQNETVAENPMARVNVAAGAAVRTAPGDSSTSITMKGPSVQVAGNLDAPGGSIVLTAKSGNLTLSGGSRVSAAGYLKPVTTTVAGLPAGDLPQAAGTVSLEATSGSIILENRARVDVSGTGPTERLIQGTNGLPVGVTVAGDPGTLNLTYGNGLVLDGEIAGQARYAGVRGGTLTIYKNANNSSSLLIAGADIRRYQESGFDDLTFESPDALEFTGATDLAVGRSLTLDAPKLTGTGRDDVTLRAPWLRLVNSSVNESKGVDAGDYGGTLTLAGDWLDVAGSTGVTRFGTVRLAARHDLRLTDADTYTSNGKSLWRGKLETAGDLVLEAARIYPTTLAGFTVKTHGTATILPSGTTDSAPIYSAGGNLTIQADKGINHQGVLVAPMGSITLDGHKYDSDGTIIGDSRVYLAEGSLVSTSGTVPVGYGSFDGTYWTVKNVDDALNFAANPRVDEAPAGSIELKGGEVIVKEGATIDMAGGGSVYTYLFQPGIEGSTDPITTSKAGRANRYVILPDNGVQLPGFSYTDANGKVRIAGAVHLAATRLDDGTWLKEGTYSLLPEQFAFLPGARIISDLGTTVAPGAQPRTSEGYQVVTGYGTFLGTDVQSRQLKGYSIRSATDVLKEGNYTVKESAAGNAGSLEVKANTAVMNGLVNAAPLPGFKPGSLSLIGTAITVQETVAGLPADFDFDSLLPAALDGQLQVAAATLTGYGLDTLKLGDTQTTTSLTVQQGSTLTARNIKLAVAAAGQLTVESGARVNGLSESGGSVTLSAPGGTVDLRANSLLHASNAMTLDANDFINLKGELLIDRGSLTLKSGNIYFVPDGDPRPAGEKGLYLTEKLWQGFSRNEELSLISRAELTFRRDVDLTVKGLLTVDARQFTGPASVTFNAGRISLLNSGASAEDPPLASTGRLTLNADEISVASSTRQNIVFKDFATVSLASRGDLTLIGAGALKTGGDLNISAARVTTSFYRDDATSYTTANFLVAANGAIDITNSGGTAGSVTTPGGTLAIQGKSITQSGTIEVASGLVQLTAKGGITLMDGARLLARGAKVKTNKAGEYEYLPGGRIILTGNDGPVNLESGSLLDVSTADQGDAGAISLISTTAGVTVDGTIAGYATAGRGGSLVLDTTTLDLTTLNGKLQKGGITERLSVRARQGNLIVAADQKVIAREIELAADAGRIDVNGTLQASDGTNGGWVELNAQQDLNVTGSIQAKGTVAGGEILLGSASGTLSLQNSALLDVSGDSAATDGTVYLRAQRIGTTGVKMALAGEIRGASSVVAEAFKVYDTNSRTTTVSTKIGTAPATTINSTSSAAITSLNPVTTITQVTKGTTITTTTVSSGSVMDNVLSEASTYMGAAGGIRDDLLSALKKPAGWDADNSQFHLRPGIEIRGVDLDLSPSTKTTTINNGKPTVVLTAAPWDLSPTTANARYGVEPGMLTLRATGNLTINENLVDHPTNRDTLTSKTIKDKPSWGLNLVAGADLQGASPLAPTATAAGKDLTIGSGKVVYTENAPIRFASANNTTINAGSVAKYMINDTMLYTLASYGGTIRGEVGNNLVLNSGIIQTALGDIDLRIGRDLNLGSNLGAIRTTGEYDFENIKVETGPGSGVIRPAKITDYWTYRNGGSISLEVGGAVAGTVKADNAWDSVYGGGGSGTKNKRLSASFDGANSTKGIATMGGGDIYVRTGGAFNSQIGAFGSNDLTYLGSGNLTIVAGGDLNGRFRVMDGSASLTTAGNFGTADPADVMPVIEMAATKLTVAALGDVHLGAVLNPDNVKRTNLFNNTGQNDWNLTYTPDTSMRIVSLTGDITFNGESTFAAYPAIDVRKRILPASLTMIAAGDIQLQNEFSQAPAKRGTLRLVAGGSIDGQYGKNNVNAILFMTDLGENIYGYQPGKAPIAAISDDPNKSLSLVHRGDKDPVEISAGVDIRNLQLFLTKKAEITAGRDIKGFHYTGQNIDPADVTSIRAGRDIHYDFILPETNILPNYGIQQSGPGALVIQAGHSIELGNSNGITTNGNFFNALLGAKGADLIVAAGAKQALQPEDAVLFFNGKDGRADHEDDSLNGLRQAGTEYTELQAQGKTAEARQRIGEARRTIISRWFDEPTNDGSGAISMTSSQISTQSGEDEIFILAKGVVNVGKSTIQSAEAKQVGIVTVKGGPINIYAGGDINVNESRVMTFMGGGITIWSDQGNINAGRGSKTAVSPPKPGEVPAAGSGLRALTYDPDGAEGPLEEPEPGDIYLFAPKGIIDAGEAGIAGGKVTLGATEVLNASNISFSAGSVGVPAASGSSVSIGALAGAGSMTDNGRMIEQSTGAGAAKDKTVRTGTQVVEDFMSKFLDIKVLSFDLDSPDNNAEKDNERDKEKKQEE